MRYPLSGTSWLVLHSILVFVVLAFAHYSPPSHIALLLCLRFRSRIVPPASTPLFVPSSSNIAQAIRPSLLQHVPPSLASHPLPLRLRLSPPSELHGSACPHFCLCHRLPPPSEQYCPTSPPLRLLSPWFEQYRVCRQPRQHVPIRRQAPELADPSRARQQSRGQDRWRQKDASRQQR